MREPSLVPMQRIERAILVLRGAARYLGYGLCRSTPYGE